jgi:hypothetical protein
MNGINGGPNGGASNGLTPGGPSDTADRYVKLMRARNYNAAYGMLDDEWKDFFSSQADFAGSMQDLEPEYAREGIVSIMFAQCDNVQVAGETVLGSSATVTFSASCTSPSGGKTSGGGQEVSLVKEGGEWKIRPGSD